MLLPFESFQVSGRLTCLLFPNNNTGGCFPCCGDLGETIVGKCRMRFGLFNRWEIVTTRCQDFLVFNAKLTQLTKKRHSGKMNDGTELNLFLPAEKLKW